MLNNCKGDKNSYFKNVHTYEVEKQIGHGAHGTVYLVKNKNDVK